MVTKIRKKRVRIRAPFDLMPIIRELCTVKIEGKYIAVIPEDIIVRQAMYIGLTSMLAEHRAKEYVRMLDNNRIKECSLSLARIAEQSHASQNLGKATEPTSEVEVA